MRNPNNPKASVGVRNTKKFTKLRFLLSKLGDNENEYKLIWERLHINSTFLAGSAEVPWHLRFHMSLSVMGAMRHRLYSTCYITYLVFFFSYYSTSSIISSFLSILLALLSFCSFLTTCLLHFSFKLTSVSYRLHFFLSFTLPFYPVRFISPFLFHFLKFRNNQ